MALTERGAATSPRSARGPASTTQRRRSSRWEARSRADSRTISNDPQQAPAVREIRVALVDGHAFYRRGLRQRLEQDAIDIVGEASDGARAVAVVRDTLPDVVLMEVAMAGHSGIEATRQIRAVAPRTQVIMLTHSADERDVEESIWAGACSYLLKDAPAEQILVAIQGAAAGESHLSPRIAAGILNRVRADRGSAGLLGECRAELTKREGEVVRLIADGKGANRRRTLYQHTDG
jgi:DNA-binding NarL/FixJ family response regulator